jgi:hypothetical protein
VVGYTLKSVIVNDPNGDLDLISGVYVSRDGGLVIQPSGAANLMQFLDQWLQACRQLKADLAPTVR